MRSNLQSLEIILENFKGPIGPSSKLALEIG